MRFRQNKLSKMRGGDDIPSGPVIGMIFGIALIIVGAIAFSNNDDKGKLGGILCGIGVAILLLSFYFKFTQ